jgi:hypothetical protein
MRNNIIITLLILVVLTLTLPLVEYHFDSEKAFTSDNLICTPNENM